MPCSCSRAATPSSCLIWHICTPIRQIPPPSLSSDPFSRQVPTHVEVFQRDVAPTRERQRPTSTVLAPSHYAQGPSILSTCLPSQKVGALQFLRALAEDGIKEPTCIRSRGEHSVKTTSTCRLRGQYKTKDYVQFTHIYIYAHRLPETSRISRGNGKKQKKVSSRDQMPPSVVASETPQLRRSSKGIFLSRPIVECTCPLESYTGAKV